MFKNLKIGVRLAVLLSFVLALLMAITLFAINGLQNAKSDLETTYVEKLVPVRLTARVQRLLEETRSQLMLGLQHNPQSELAKLHDHPLSMHIEAIKKSLDDVEATLKELKQREISNSQEKADFEAFEKSAREYSAEGLEPALKALVAGQYHESNIELLAKTNPKANRMREAAKTLRDYYGVSSSELFQEASAHQARVVTMMVAMGVLAFVLAIALGVWITRSVTRPITQAVDLHRRGARLGRQPVGRLRAGQRHFAIAVAGLPASRRRAWRRPAPRSSR
jgi:hypothetical protein